MNSRHTINLGQLPSSLEERCVSALGSLYRSVSPKAPVSTQSPRSTEALASDVYRRILDAVVQLTESPFALLKTFEFEHSPLSQAAPVSKVLQRRMCGDWHVNHAPPDLDLAELDRAVEQLTRAENPLPSRITIRRLASASSQEASTHEARPNLLWLFPLYVDGDLLGALCFGPSRQPENIRWNQALETFTQAAARFLQTADLKRRCVRLESELRERQQRWDFALEASAGGTFDWDISRNELHLSPRWKAMFGTSPEDAPESVTAWRQRIHPEDLPPMTRAMEAHLSGSTVSFECEYRLRHHDGSWRWIAGRGRVITWDDNGSPSRFVGTQTDVTDRKADEQALFTAREAAVSAARGKSDLLTVISHELRSPLNAVHGMATLLAETPLDAQQRDYVTAIRSDSSDLLSVLDNVLDLSTLEAGELHIEPYPFDPRALATDVLYLMKAHASAKGLSLRFSGPLHPVWALGNARAVRQVLLHLVDNAVKFTESGTITVSFSHSNDGVPRVWFGVEDTGVGIAEDQLPLIFEPFVKLNHAHIPSPGTGLGLTICRHLVQSLSGELGVQSQEGRGSTFELSVPAPLTAAPSLPREDSADWSAVIDRKLRERTPCILVAEDNPVNQKVARAFLERLGARVDCVDNGLEAVQALARFPYDLVLMDCQMPIMDGFEATERIRNMDGNSGHTPVIALTANALERARERSVAVGMNAFLTKPLQGDALRLTLHDSLFGHRRL